MERILFLFGRPISPHAPLAESIELPADFQRVSWVPLLPNMLEALGLTREALALETATRLFEPTEPVDDCPCFRIVLADGCSTELRFRTASGSGESARCHRRPEFAVANRNIPVPDIESMAHRVLHYFADTHAVVEFAEEAQELFVAYAACFSAEVLRDNDDDSAARKGTAAWHLGVLAAAQLVWDIATEQADSRLVAESRLRIQAHHVLRAYALSQAASATQQRESALEQQRIPESQFVKFEVAQESAAEDGEPGLSQSDSPPLSDGYGPGGSSVQAVMLRTLLRGEPVIFARRVVDACSKKTTVDNKTVRTSLKLAHWLAVINAGMEQHCIGEVQTLADRKGPRLVLHLPKSNDREAVRVYHNRLMALCGLSFAAFSKRLVEVASKGGGSGARVVAATADEQVSEEGVLAVRPRAANSTAAPKASVVVRPRAAKSRAAPKASIVAKQEIVSHDVGLATTSKARAAPTARRAAKTAVKKEVVEEDDDDCIIIEASVPASSAREKTQDAGDSQGSKCRKLNEQLGNWHC
ncbi:unnamed protein product [Symbiodinium natans]|uniref:Uncharacterized protein n=1 Tax=Symbiodinium natans TaxID=878477 RepID=A0A812TF73_9DINO|nr:unnamed protein product [Symbiodinium natans]